ncbi:hypothetical protein SELMODRAFT_413384 [Selaginella moellendorffii]|uniref:GH16 domain-containing protein n=1 Tax=Selaginella moellendorffii TaxID=88036 RepID=D8RPA0_SELML|nr:hypothetical protein SELMODRAFT_413384 [Selaginella moellendorffii]
MTVNILTKPVLPSSFLSSKMQPRGTTFFVKIGFTLPFALHSLPAAVRSGREIVEEIQFRGCKAPCRADSVEESADIIEANTKFGLGSVILIGVPIPAEHAAAAKNVESTIQSALHEAESRGIAVTPFLLKRVNELTGAESLAASAGFGSRSKYLFGRISMKIKLVPNDSAGTVTAFYMSLETDKHDEIDFEFLGNLETGSSKPTSCSTTLRTSTATPSSGTSSRSCSTFPLRVHENNVAMGIPFPKIQPMGIYSSLWNGDDWATDQLGPRSIHGGVQGIQCGCLRGGCGVVQRSPGGSKRYSRASTRKPKASSSGRTTT